MKYADLHTHTYYSDGSHSPEELIKLAEQSDVSAIAITDHDTVDGLKPSFQVKTSVEIIPGIEFTAELNNIELHILGYFIDWQDKNLRAKLEEIKYIRRKRIYKFKEKLATLKVDIEPEKIIEAAGCGTVGRLHIARYLVDKKYVTNNQEAFRKYLADKAPGYVSAFHLKPIEAIQLIKQSRGLAILAHPYTLANPSLIFKLIEDGIIGLEIYYPEHDNSITQRLKNIANKYSLLITGGSDYHGDAKPNISIGATKVSYKLVEKLKKAKEDLIG